MNDPQDGRERLHDAIPPDVLKAIGNSKGRCPDIGLLAGYVKGDCTGDEAAHIRSHIAACGLCDCLLERMRAFEDAHRGESHAGAAGRGHRSLARWILHPAIGYLAALALAYPAYLGIMHQRQRTAMPQPASPVSIEPAPNLDLNLVRGEKNPIPVDSRGRFFILSFFIPMRPDVQYSAAIQDSSGAAVAQIPTSPAMTAKATSAWSAHENAFVPDGMPS